MENKLRAIILGTILSFIPLSGHAQILPIEDTPSFNHKTIESTETTIPYSFFVGGHLYGSHNASIYPASSLLANIETLNKQDTLFFISLGDIIKKGEETYLNTFQHSFGEAISIPIFNSVGNHDLPFYQSELNTKKLPLFYAFQYQQSAFIFLDSITENGNIMGKQKEFLFSILDEIKQKNEIEHIFILSHYLIWANTDNIHKNAYLHANSISKYNQTNFSTDILPHLKQEFSDKQIYLLAGDVGTEWSYPLYFHKEKNIHFIATGIGDTPVDKILKFSIHSKEVDIDVISLTEEKTFPIETYTDPYNHQWYTEKTLLEKIKNIMLHKYFLLGLFTSVPFSYFFYRYGQYRMALRKKISNT